MELRHLRYFCAVADKLSFTKAAQELRVAQPALTRQIHDLEEELGVKLLNRSKNRVALTEQGRTFLIDAKHLLELAAQSVRAVQRLDRGETGSLISLTCPGSTLNSCPGRWKSSAVNIHRLGSTCSI